MEFAKKYWWLIALVVVFIFLFITSKKSTNKPPEKKEPDNWNSEKGCYEISYDEWNKRKHWLYNNKHGDWNMAHLALLDEGYCEHLE